MHEDYSLEKDIKIHQIYPEEAIYSRKNFVSIGVYKLIRNDIIIGELEIRYSNKKNFLYSFLSDIEWNFELDKKNINLKKFVLIISDHLSDSHLKTLNKWIKYKNHKMLGNYWEKCLFYFTNIDDVRKLNFYKLFENDLMKTLSKIDNPIKEVAIKNDIKPSDKISIITVVYNDEKKIEQTIQSVIAQNSDNIEYIVIDGRSNDETTKIIQNYIDYIDIYISEPDKGIFDAMNKGIKLSGGNLHLFLNSGDFLLPNTINSDITAEGLVNVWFEDRFGNTKLRQINHPIIGMPYPHQGYLLNMKKQKFDLNYSYAADYNYLLSKKKFIQKKYNGGVYFDNTGVSSIFIYPRFEVIKLQLKYFGFQSLPYVIFNLIKILGMLFLKLVK